MKLYKCILVTITEIHVNANSEEQAINEIKVSLMLDDFESELIEYVSESEILIKCKEA